MDLSEEQGGTGWVSERRVGGAKMLEARALIQSQARRESNGAIARRGLPGQETRAEGAPTRVGRFIPETAAVSRLDDPRRNVPLVAS